MSGPRNLLAAKPTGKLRVDLTSTTLATGSWTSIGTIPAACTAVSIAYTGEGILKFSTNNGTSELPFYVVPGQSIDHLIPLELAKNLTLYARCVDQAVATGELVFNFYG